MCDVFQRGVEWIILNQRTTMNVTNVDPLCACEAFNCLLQRIIRIGLGGTHGGLEQRTRGSGEGLIRRHNCLTEQSEGANLDRPDGERARLIGADHGGGSERLYTDQAANQHMLAGQGEIERVDHREFFWDRRDDEAHCRDDRRRPAMSGQQFKDSH